MINILGGRSKAEFDDTCRKIKQNGLEQRPFRLIISKNRYTLAMEITVSELMKLEEENIWH